MAIHNNSLCKASRGFSATAEFLHFTLIFEKQLTERNMSIHIFKQLSFKKVSRVSCHSYRRVRLWTSRFLV